MIFLYASLKCVANFDDGQRRNEDRDRLDMEQLLVSNSTEWQEPNIKDMEHGQIK